MPDKSARICAVITESGVAAARAAMQSAAAVADIIELRLDYLRDFDFNNPDRLSALLDDKPLPVIVTCRAVDEGGQQEVAEAVRLRLLTEALRRGADYCDIEAAHYDEGTAARLDASRLIVSYHNFSKTPADLSAIYERLTRRPAAIHKIAVRANDITDALRVLGLLDRAATEHRPLIAIAMQEAGLLTRILGPVRGSFLTYGSLARGHESAPGQVTCEELRDLYRIHRLTPDTQVVGIVGRPVSHSASPQMHNRAFQEMGLDFVYLPFEVNEVGEFFKRLVRPATREIDWPLRGFSVTIPHKAAVIPFLDELDETARRIGAVNTVVIKGERLIGYNTDADGAMAPLEAVTDLRQARCAVIGTGGSARALVFGLRERGARVTLFARNPAKAAALANEFDLAAHPVESLATSDAEIIINTTPVGMLNHDEGTSLVRRDVWADRKIAYDLIYNPPETRFLADARLHGCVTINGVEMLAAQAARQFELWTGRKPPIEVLRAAILEKVNPA
ncbi:MAG TPA: shikimate dehydrogenase [Blastocatellia bacterium]|nr:shikimate dehydrogenase [Blastocatellia bacterium]